MSQWVLDFTFTTGSSQSATVSPGQSASFYFTLAPHGVLSDASTFSATGLPPGATATFTPSSIHPAANSSKATMTVQTAV